MSHRDKSLTPWITNDPDAAREKRKAATARAQQYPLSPNYQPVPLPPSVYDAAERDGYDMRYFMKQQLIPLDAIAERTIDRLVADGVRPITSAAELEAAGNVEVRYGAFHDAKILPGVYAAGSRVAPLPYSLTRRGNPVRKHISERTCHGKDCVCMPGLNGNCAACFDDD